MILPCRGAQAGFSLTMIVNNGALIRLERRPHASAASLAAQHGGTGSRADQAVARRRGP